jgi:hypothetical protein
MKCPKCGFISFDYNLSCPKCNKDISSEQEKLHIPAFRPDPPFLLGALTGEANESQVGPAPTGSQISFEKEADISLDDSSLNDVSPLGSGEIAVEDSSELNLDSGELSLDDTSSLSMDTGEVQAQVAKGLQRPKAEKGKLGSGEFKLEPETDLGDLDLGEEGEEELSLDSVEKKEEAAASQEAADSEMDITLDLEEDEAAGSESNEDLLSPVSAETSAPELEPLDLEAEGAQGKEEIELSLDDLKINDTGELELGSDSKASGDLDNLLEMDEIKLDEIPLTEAPPKSKREARVVTAAAPKKKGAVKSADDELSLDLDDLDLDLEMEDAKPQR